VYQFVATEADARRFPPPGQLVDVGGYRLDINCIGEGSPTVILESGLRGAMPVWGWVQPEVARLTRVCAYDRAGDGRSEPGPDPRDATRIAGELHTLLTNCRDRGAIRTRRSLVRRDLLDRLCLFGSVPHPAAVILAPGSVACTLASNRALRSRRVWRCAPPV